MNAVAVWALVCSALQAALLAMQLTSGEPSMGWSMFNAGACVFLFGLFLVFLNRPDNPGASNE